ncbi:MAG: phage head-tail connector protein [Gemmatimonadales bacterium]|nr:phage head-tail connector protein [Gemmatimonadales bacterium]
MSTLTTLANYKAHAGITDSADDALITLELERATKAIQVECDRDLVADTYRERYNGEGDCEIILDQYPITAISLVSTDVLDIISIANTSTDAYNASVDISATTMTLTISGGSDAGSDALTLSSYTLTTLVAAIDALGKGWDAELLLSDYGVWAATELLPVYGRGCLDQLTYATIPGTPAEDYVVATDEGVITFASSLTRGTQNIVVKYSAGWATIPADLERIAIELTDYYYRGRKIDPSIQAEKLGDHSITYSKAQQSNAIPEGLVLRLAKYRRWMSAD